jgi:hypothetical protein
MSDNSPPSAMNLIRAGYYLEANAQDTNGRHCGVFDPQAAR